MSESISDYGVSDSRCSGRAHSEVVPALWTPFEFDRRRVQASSAFRRLQYKTQVFISPRGDHYRTRLTHTLEVADIARLVARALGVNTVLAEVIALAHDLGHPPFGHAGEAALNEVMRGFGGFEHNAQSLRVVEQLEHPFPPFRGLNLTCEVREALAKHRTIHDHPVGIDTDDAMLLDLLQRGVHPTIEGQIVALADRLAYDCHDLEDALGAELIEGHRLETLSLWDHASAEVRQTYPERSLFAIWRPVLERLQQRLIADALSATAERIDRLRITSPDLARLRDTPLVGFSEELELGVGQLEDFLRANVYLHPRLRDLDATAGRMITELFNAYVQEPRRLPPRFQERIGRQGIERVACDYVAGMTDRFCENEYRRIFLPFVQRP